MGDMLALLPAGEPAGTLFLAMYLRRLPASMRDHLTTADFATPAEMMAHADLLWDARSSQSAWAIEMPITAILGRATTPTDRGASEDEAGDADAAEAVGSSRRRVASGMPTRSMSLRHIQ